jgi:hypothetical protein
MTRKSVSSSSTAPTLAGFAVALAAAVFLVVVAVPDQADERDRAAAGAGDPAAHEERDEGAAGRAAQYKAESKADFIRPASI